jgi:DNA-binding MarR family transcriptional regulator
MMTAPAKTRRFDSPEQEAFLGLWRTYDRLRALEDAVFERAGLTSQQYNVLRLLAAAWPTKIRTLELASRLISRAPDITRMLDKLEQRGLIDRDRPASNRRTVEVGITARGREVLEELRLPIRDCHRSQLGHLAPKQLRELIALLKVVREPHEDAESLWR